MILYSQFNLAIQFRRQGQFCCLPLILSKMFELHASMPPMQSAECQATISQKFPIIIVVTSLDGIYGWSIQTLLREENDLKQSDKNSGNQ